MPISIYALVDPRTEAVFYVGKTKQPLKPRLNQHISPAQTGRKNGACARRIREILAEGKRPDILLLEENPPDHWRKAEGRWVQHFLEAGTPLENTISHVGTGGADGYPPGWSPEIEARLGKVADAVLAAELGLTRKAISYWRSVLRIPASHDRTRSKSPPRGRVFERMELPEELIRRLGTIPDQRLADEFGVSKRTVIRRRDELGIPPYAARTGNNGQFRKGNFPGRWLKQRRGVHPGGAGSRVPAGSDPQLPGLQDRPSAEAA